MPKANPLGELMYELVVNGVTEGGSLNLDGTPGFRSQVPVKDGLAGQDTFKQDAMKTTSRAQVEKDRMHIDSGMDVKGANMFKELGGGTGKSAGEFTSNKTA